MDNGFSKAYRELNARIISLLDSFSALSALSALDLRDVDETTMIRNALKGLMENLDIERCSVFLLKDSELVVCTGLDWDDLLIGDNGEVLKYYGPSAFTASVGEGIMGLAVQYKSLQHCRDCSADSRFKTAPDQKSGSLISVPIFQMGGEVLGVLNISHSTPNYFNEWHERFLAVYCHCLGQLLSNFRLVNHMELEIEKRTAQLYHSQKMEAIGQLAGGVAHDFNNIITAVSGYAHLLFMKMSPDDPLRHFAEQIIVSSERAANLTQSLLAFSRKQVVHPKPVNVNSVISSVEKLLHRLIGEDITLKTDLSERELFVLADSGQFEQIVINLATNARDAMPDGGELTIATRNEEIDGSCVRLRGVGSPGKYVRISVSDTGIGMDDKVREKIFEPFFTTKEVGKGTGLGLAIVYGIVSQQKGFIDVRSGIGAGSTFNIYLPAIKEQNEQSMPENQAAPITGNETVLIVEDDEDLRRFDVSFLEQFGYRVVTAIDGELALEKFACQKDKIDIVILDVVLPGISGKEVHDRINEMRPGTKVLFTSGYTPDVIERKGLSVEKCHFIEKPRSPLELLKKMREVLDGKPK
ncbi:MAG TPA: ATP-binding protein [Geobacteraceae bacterium]|nr:ATP-binding protein [Geobacteraceae bacterium]